MSLASRGSLPSSSFFSVRQKTSLSETVLSEAKNGMRAYAVLGDRPAWSDQIARILVDVAEGKESLCGLAQ